MASMYAGEIKEGTYVIGHQYASLGNDKTRTKKSQYFASKNEKTKDIIMTEINGSSLEEAYFEFRPFNAKAIGVFYSIDNKIFENVLVLPENETINYIEYNSLTKV